MIVSSCSYGESSEQNQPLIQIATSYDTASKFVLYKSSIHKGITVSPPPNTKWQGLTLIEKWLYNHLLNKGWAEITYPFPNNENNDKFKTHFIVNVTNFACWYVKWLGIWCRMLVIQSRNRWAMQLPNDQVWFGRMVTPTTQYISPQQVAAWISLDIIPGRLTYHGEFRYCFHIIIELAVGKIGLFNISNSFIL